MMTGFTCYRCGRVHAADGYRLTCPACGGNLAVTYDLDALRERADEGRLLDASRRDIFRYAALLPVCSAGSAPPLVVGPTPLYPVPRLGEVLGMANLWVKDDSQLPSASFKDRASTVAVAVAREQGAEVIAAASTGNAGSSLAGLCASVGMPCVVVVPASAPAPKLAQLAAFGAKVLAVRGTYDEACAVCRDLCDAKGWFNRMTGINPYTREGKKTVSLEVWEQLGRTAPDRVVVSVGDGNIISGVWKGWRELADLGMIDKPPRIDAVQAEGSAAIAHAVACLRAGASEQLPRWDAVAIAPVNARTVADSISVDAPLDGLAAVRAVLESGGEAVTVSDEAIVRAVPELARTTGVFAEPAAAAVLAGLRRMREEGRVDPGESVVLLSTGSGLKDPRAATASAPPPTEIDPTIEAANDAVAAMGL